MRDIVSGVVLIGIGVAIGDSVFTSDDPSALGYVFDGVGTLWILKGIYGLVSGGSAEAAST